MSILGGSRRWGEVQCGRERARLFSLPERFNQVHIGAADQKDPLLVRGSWSRVFAPPRLLKSLKENIHIYLAKVKANPSAYSPFVIFTLWILTKIYFPFIGIFYPKEAAANRRRQYSALKTQNSDIITPLAKHPALRRHTVH